MAYTLPAPIPWPYARAAPFAAGTAGTIDAGAVGVGSEQVAFFGYWHLNGRVASATLDTTGSSSIGWSGGTNVFADALSIVRVGIQGVGTGGPIAQPDGTWGAYSQITTAAPTTPVLSSDNQWIVAIPTTGTSTITHGALGCVVFEFYTRSGADSIQINTGSNGFVGMLPTTNVLVGAGPAWQTTVTLGAGQNPIVVITCSDGTIATFYGAPFVGTRAARTWTDATNPDERGTLFKVPYACKADGIWLAYRNATDATSDFTLSLTSTPTSARADVITPIAVDASQLGPISQEGLVFINFAEVSLAANTEYCASIKATGAGSITWNEVTLGAAAHRAFYPGGTTISATTANAGGNFAAGTTTLLHPIGVMISQDTTAAGSSGFLIT